MKKIALPVLAVFLALSGVTLAQQSGGQKKGSSMMESMPDMMKDKQSGEGGMHGQGYDEFAGLRPYRSGDSLRHIAWKAAARDDTLLTKQFAGRADAELWLSWDALPQGFDTEQRLSHLVRWVLDADRAGLACGLRIPGCTLPIASGAAHRTACLSALALYGSAAADHY